MQDLVRDDAGKALLGQVSAYPNRWMRAGRMVAVAKPILWQFFRPDQFDPPATAIDRQPSLM